MPTIQKAVVLPAPVEKVWNIFDNITLYAPRLEPHTLSFEITPPGPPSVGQKIHAVVAAGRRNVEVYSEVTEVVPGKKVVETHVPNISSARWSRSLHWNPLQTEHW